MQAPRGFESPPFRQLDFLAKSQDGHTFGSARIEDVVVARYPTAFGKYLLLERINVGGMAEVFKAKTFGVHGYQRIMALKRILPNIMEDEDFIRMFIDEARIASHLEHGNVVRILELGQHGESLYIAMEFVQGRDLRQLVNTCRKRGIEIPPGLVAYIIMEAAKGLDYAHRRTDLVGNPLHIIHRDVSPQNLLLSWDGDVKVCDFGIAKAQNRAHQTQAGVLKGKFAYMSPEQVRGKAIDHRSDIFGLGTIAHEMISGRRLFLGESDFSTLERVRKAQAPRLDLERDDVERDFSDAILTALARDPNKRFAWASDFADALQPWLIDGRRILSGRDLAEFLRQVFPGELEQDRQRMQDYLAMEAPADLSESAPSELRLEGSYDELSKEMLDAVAESDRTVIFDTGTVEQLDTINTDQERTILHDGAIGDASLPPPSKPVATASGDDEKTVLATLEELQAAGLDTLDVETQPAQPAAPPPPPSAPGMTVPPPPPGSMAPRASTMAPPPPPPPGGRGASTPPSPMTAGGNPIPVIAPVQGKGGKSPVVVAGAGLAGALVVFALAWVIFTSFASTHQKGSGTTSEPKTTKSTVTSQKESPSESTAKDVFPDGGVAAREPTPENKEKVTKTESSKPKAAKRVKKKSSDKRKLPESSKPQTRAKKQQATPAVATKNRKSEPDTPEAADCVLTVLTTPQGAKVKLGRAELGPSPVSQTGLDCQRSYQLEVSHPGYLARKARFSFGANKKKRMSLSLQAKQKPKARPKASTAAKVPESGKAEGPKVQIGTPGVRARVSIDGKSYGQTPLAGTRAPKLRPGRHRLVLSSGGQTWKYTITVPSGRERVSLVIKTLGEPVSGVVRAIPD